MAAPPCAARREKANDPRTDRGHTEFRARMVGPLKHWSSRLLDAKPLPPVSGCVAISVDSMVDGIHFDEDTSPEELGYKALAVNLSDMAAMGATPRSARLALVAPSAQLGDQAGGSPCGGPSVWLEEFARGLLSLADEFNVIWRGSALREGPLNVTVEIDGTIAGNPLRRDGAEPGDIIYVSGTLGDAGAALKLRSSHFAPDDIRFLQARLKHPTPRVELGAMASRVAHSAIDLSDGLASDLKHVLQRSLVTAEINLDRIPLSAPVAKNLEPWAAWELAVSFGDDYELLLTVPENRAESFEEQANAIGCPVTRIGHVKPRDGHSLPGSITWTNSGQPTEAPKFGYSHFS